MFKNIELVIIFGLLKGAFNFFKLFSTVLVIPVMYKIINPINKWLRKFYEVERLINCYKIS